METMWDILGIAPTTDKKTIRKAYAEKCRQCHPEESPEEFKQLRHAYENALCWNSPGVSLSILSGQEIIETVTTQKKDREDLMALVSRGLKNDESLRTAAMMERIGQLHQSLPSTKRANKQVLFDAIDQWASLYDSADFQNVKWLPSFLHPFTLWLKQNQDRMDRAAVIGLYLAYDFNRFYEPDFPKPEGMTPFHDQVLLLAGRYEKDLVFHAEMIPLKQQNKSNTPGLCDTVISLCILLLPLLLLCMVIRSTSTDPAANTYSYDYSNWYPTSQSEGIWPAHNLFTMAFPAGYPVSEESPILISSGTEEQPGSMSAYPVDYVPKPILLYLSDHGHPDASVECIRKISEDQPGIFQVTLSNPEDLTYELYVEAIPDQPAYGRIAASTYYPELFNHFSYKHDLRGRVWTDNQNQVHIAMVYAGPSSGNSIEKALLSSYREFYKYHQKKEPDAEVPPMNLTIRSDVMGLKWIDDYKNGKQIPFAHSSWYYMTVARDALTPIYFSHGDQLQDNLSTIPSD